MVFFLLLLSSNVIDQHLRYCPQFGSHRCQEWMLEKKCRHSEVESSSRASKWISWIKSAIEFVNINWSTKSALWIKWLWPGHAHSLIEYRLWKNLLFSDSYCIYIKTLSNQTCPHYISYSFLYTCRITKEKKWESIFINTIYLLCMCFSLSQFSSQYNLLDDNEEFHKS